MGTDVSGGGEELNHRALPHHLRRPVPRGVLKLEVLSSPVPRGARGLALSPDTDQSPHSGLSPGKRHGLGTQWLSSVKGTQPTLPAAVQ